MVLLVERLTRVGAAPLVLWPLSFVVEHQGESCRADLVVAFGLAREQVAAVHDIRGDMQVCLAFDRLDEQPPVEDLKKLRRSRDQSMPVWAEGERTPS